MSACAHLASLQIGRNAAPHRTPRVNRRVVPTRERALAGLAILALALPATGCSDLGQPLHLVPRAEVSSSSLDFGTVALNTTARRTVVVGNSGTADLQGFASVSCADYAIESGGGAFTVPPTTQHTIVVAYHPTAIGASPCQLELGGGLPPVDMNGAGSLQAVGAQCELSVTSLDFGALQVGTSRLSVFTIRNPGTAPTQLDVVPTCGVFNVVTGGGASLLAPGDSLVVTLGFAPSASGAVACAIATGPGCPDLPVTGFGITVSFAADILPIWQSRGCVSCHGWKSAADVVDVTTAGYAPDVIVKPFDPAHSVMYGKILGLRQYGQRMPQGGAPLPLAETNRIRDWIAEGARAN